MFEWRLDNIVTYLQHPITNAVTESLNAKIQWVKYTARGFRNQQNFITAIYFHCGGLDLAPSPTQNPEERESERVNGGPGALTRPDAAGR